jgi:hypothetical protein
MALQTRYAPEAQALAILWLIRVEAEDVAKLSLGEAALAHANPVHLADGSLVHRVRSTEHYLY